MEQKPEIGTQDFWFLYLVQAIHYKDGLISFSPVFFTIYKMQVLQDNHTMLKKYWVSSHPSHYPHTLYTESLSPHRAYEQLQSTSLT